MFYEFDGKRILITGGGKGVGKAIAKAFAKRGARVIINYFHSHEEAKHTVAELTAMGTTVDLIRASVAKEDQVNRMFDEVESRFGALDILINNAAHGVLLANDELTEEHLDRAMNTNFRGALWCSRRAAKLMSAGGAIVNISSLGANWVVANYLAVGTSKAALESLTRYHAVEYAPRGIRVNAVSATLIDGSVAEMFPDPEGTKRSSIVATPLKRLATEDELANVALFLASPAASWVTGQVIVADGGLTLASESLGPRAAPIDFSPPTPQPSGASRGPDGLDDDDVVVVAMGLALPGASAPQEFWDLLEAPRELFEVTPADRWDYRSFTDSDPSAVDKSYQENSVFITDFKPHARLSEEIERGAAPEEMTTRWLRHALLQALDDTRLSPGDRTTFYVGYTADGSQHLEEAMVLAGLESRAENAKEPDAGAYARLMTRARARYQRGAKGFADFLPHRVGLEAMKGVLPDDADVMMVDTACSSSLYSIDLGLRALRQGHADVAICGGAFGLAPRGTVLFSKLNGLSRGGRVRSLDKSADGVLFADGAGVVVLKKWSRARRDGDTVLGVVESFGASSDGKGKAIYAPSSDGQAIAIRRAYPEGSALTPRDVDWVIAHATGTPAGDLAEFESLRRMFDGDQIVQVTSNKSLIGHTGWTAGVASVIQALLSISHGRISKQFRFESPPDDFRLDATTLRIPRENLAWPARPGHRRRVAVSGFGFGGTNGHLVLGDASAASAAAPKAARNLDESPLAIVGWSAVFPGLDGRDAVRAWLKGQGDAPNRSFGGVYPLPPFERVRMPPAVLRILDRCQLMALDAAHELRKALTPLWDSASNEIGVVMGHMGATGNSALYATRCYVDDVDVALGDDEPARALLRQVRAEIGAAVAPTSENSFPGMMPNVIPARIANYYNLHGPNMTVDLGHASFYAALRASARYLRTGDLSLAIVGGVNGNTTPECAPASEQRAAEGVVLFGVMTLDAARAAGIPALATLEEAAPIAASAPSPLVTADGAPATWLGADGALDILRAIVREEKTTVGRAADSRAPLRHGVKVRPAGAAAAANQPLAAAPAKGWAPWLLGIGSAEIQPAANQLPLQLERFAVEWREETPPSGLAMPFLPQGVVLLTNEPALIEALGPLPATARVFSLAPVAEGQRGWTHVTAPEEGALDEILPQNVKHLRIVSSGRLLRGGLQSLAAVSEEALKLHDLAFLAIKRSYDALGRGGDLLALLTEAVVDGRQHPMCGLFSGLIKSLSLELPGCRSRLLSTSDADVAAGARKAEREGASQGELPVAFYNREIRYALGARHVSEDAYDETPLPLGPESVVVAIGGARGITAATLKGLLPLTRSKVWLVGASPLNEDPSLLDLDDEAFAKTRPAFMRDAIAKTPGLGPVSAAQRFNRLIADRTVRRTIDRFRALCGADRVRYVKADVLDRSALDALAARVAAEDGRVDLLINAAGIGRSAAINTKTLAEFRSIRDVKARGYLNLRAAFAALAPKMWCNFGSLIGLTGQSGEADYASGNDFLSANSFWHRAQGADEFTIGWTLWGETGMASNELLRAFYERSDFYTTTRPAEGVWHFLRELRIPDRGAATVQLGSNEKTAMGSLLPGFLEKSRKRATRLVSSTPPSAVMVEPPRAIDRNGAFYLGAELSRAPDAATFERIFDLGSDGYLQHHLVNGFATLPGTFVTEIAAEAALQLVEGHVVGFEDAVFHHFLRVYDRTRPMAKRISASVIDRVGGLTRVRVVVTGDVVSPTGVVLKKDKLHFEMKAVVADDYGPAPVWTHWPARPCTEISDPYHFPEAPVLLTGPFVSTTATCETPLGKRARYDLKLAPDDPVFSRFIIPTILLDGLARVGVLHIAAGEWIPLAAPVTIGRIDLWRPENDIGLSRAVSPIDLYVSPSGFDLATPDAVNLFVAADPEGRVIAQMRDVTGVVTGYVHKTTGEFMSAVAVDALVSASRVRTPALDGAIA